MYAFHRDTFGNYVSASLVPLRIRKDGRRWALETTETAARGAGLDGRRRERPYLVDTFGTLAEAKAAAAPMLNHPQGVAACQGWAMLSARKLDGFGGHGRAARHDERMRAYLVAWRTRRIVATGETTSYLAALSEPAYTLVPPRDGGDGFPYWVEADHDDLDAVARDLGIDLDAAIDAGEQEGEYVGEHTEDIGYKLTEDTSGMYVLEYRDSRERWHRARLNFGSAASAIETAGKTYQYGWRVLDADGRQIADHLGRGSLAVIEVSEAMDTLAYITGEAVTSEDTREVITWVREWVADIFGGRDYLSDDNAGILRTANRLIEGGLAFVLSDVRRVAQEATVDGDIIEARLSDDDMTYGAPERARYRPLTTNVPRESELYELGRTDSAAGRPMARSESYYVKGYENAPREPGGFGAKVDAAMGAAAIEAAEAWQTTHVLADDVQIVKDILADLPAAKVPAFLARVGRVRFPLRGTAAFTGLDILDRIAAE